jgi:hypothetical protein
MWSMRRLFCIWVTTLAAWHGGAASGLQAAENRKPLVTFPERAVPIKKWLRANGWESKRHSPSRFVVGGGSLNLVSKSDSVMIGTQNGFPFDPSRWRTLRMVVKVDEVPTGTDLTKKSGDDAALRIYLAFGEAKGFLSPPLSLAFAWTEAVAVGTVVKSPHYDHVKSVSVGRGKTAGKWVTVERDIAVDFKRAFPGQDLLPCTGIMLKCDSNNTKTAARSCVRAIDVLAD